MELLVKINSVDGSSSYKDGDIVDVFSSDRTSFMHAEQICSVDNFALDPVTGLRTNDSLLMKFLERTCVYKFERVNSNDVLRTVIDTGTQDTINTTPNANGEYMNVYEYLTTILKRSRHTVFGTSGREIWYGGSKNPDLAAIWNDIETHSDKLKQDHSSWPFTMAEKRHLLVLNCCSHLCENDHYDHHCLDGSCHCELSEIPDLEAREKAVGVYGEAAAEHEAPPLIAKRKFQVPYWDHASSLSLDVDSIRNMNMEVDGRKNGVEVPAVQALTIDKVEAGIITL